jgi:superfamily II DNA/RNA helicase
MHAEDYIHRIGRTGRAGREGRSFMLASPEDGFAVAAIVKLIGKEIPPCVIDDIEPAELHYEERRGRRGRRSARPQTRERVPGHDAAARPKPNEDRPPRRSQPRSTEGARSNGHSMAATNVTPFPRAPGPRGNRQPKRAPEQDRPVVGFGDDLPAFLARPPRILAGS